MSRSPYRKCFTHIAAKMNRHMAKKMSRTQEYYSETLASAVNPGTARPMTQCPACRSWNASNYTRSTGPLDPSSGTQWGCGEQH